MHSLHGWIGAWKVGQAGERPSAAGQTALPPENPLAPSVGSRAFWVFKKKWEAFSRSLHVADQGREEGHDISMPISA